MSFPQSLQDAYSRLSPETQRAVDRDYAARAKSLGFAYAAWFLFGWHYIYLRRIGMQVAFWLTAGGLVMWWIADAFRLPALVRRLNEDTARELMVQHRALS